MMNSMRAMITIGKFCTMLWTIGRDGCWDTNIMNGAKTSNRRKIRLKILTSLLKILRRCFQVLMHPNKDLSFSEKLIWSVNLGLLASHADGLSGESLDKLGLNNSGGCKLSRTSGGFIQDIRKVGRRVLHLYEFCVKVFNFALCLFNYVFFLFKIFLKFGDHLDDSPQLFFLRL